jgi:hypothetical protein
MHQRCCLRFALPATDLDVVGRGVVLHFHAGVEDVLTRRLFHAHANAQSSQPSRQRRVGNGNLLCRQLLGDAHPVSCAALV